MTFTSLKKSHKLFIIMTFKLSLCLLSLHSYLMILYKEYIYIHSNFMYVTFFGVNFIARSIFD